MTRDELERDLRTLPGVHEVRVEGNGTLVATVVSAAFEGRDEADRQDAVWSLLRRAHGDRALENIEFIFTNAPNDPD